LKNKADRRARQAQRERPGKETGVRLTALFTIAGLLFPSVAQAEVKIGVLISLTGPAASLGIPVKNTVELWPTEIGGEAVRYIVLDDASDTTTAVKAARKLVDEEKVDAIIGPSVTPTSLAILEVVGPAHTAMVSLAGSNVIAAPVEGNKTWSFKITPGEALQAAQVLKDMQKKGAKTVAFIGFNDAFGDAFLGGVKKVLEPGGIKVLADERYSRTDTSVAAQALRVMSSNPDAVVIGASGTPGVLPVIELKKLGYQGQIYINQGMANADVLRVGGADLDGIKFAAPPVLVAEQLLETNPIKPIAVTYVKSYEAKFGANSRSLFGATGFDALLLIQNAVKQAQASGAKSGTPEFRTALRDFLQQTKELITTSAIYNMSASDHNGADRRGEILVAVESGKWKYVPGE
jgi:branched-chain amino acid transport system substrate-binding protein